MGQELFQIGQTTFGDLLFLYRILTAVVLVCVVSLFIYQIRCLVLCMRKGQADLPGQYDKPIWVALIVLIPAGIGAWVYDFVINKIKCHPFFGVPFCILAICVVIMFASYIGIATKFNIDRIFPFP